MSDDERSGIASGIPTDGREIRSRGPLVGGIIAAGLSLLILWAAGRVGGGEARMLLESSLPTIRFLCSTTGAAAATILALMLTLLSLSLGHDVTFRERHFERIRRISKMSTICLVGSVFVLLLLVVPIESSERVSGRGYAVVYYVVLGATSLLGGLIVAIMLMLYNAILGLVHLVHPEEDSFLVPDEPDADGAASADTDEVEVAGERTAASDRRGA